MIVIRNDSTDEVTFQFDGGDVTLNPNKTAQINEVDFGKLFIDNLIVKVRNGVIKIKGAE